MLLHPDWIYQHPLEGAFKPLVLALSNLPNMKCDCIEIWQVERYLSFEIHNRWNLLICVCVFTLTIAWNITKTILIYVFLFKFHNCHNHWFASVHLWRTFAQRIMYDKQLRSLYSQLICILHLHKTFSSIIIAFLRFASYWG